MPAPAILVQDLVKRYGDVEALGGVSMQVPTGSVLGLLGPNGAGKTTAVRILTTLLAPDGGRAEVLGVDVTADPELVRVSIGLAGQNAAVDENLTGRENLELFGRLYRLDRHEARKRSDELLERFDLTGAATRLVNTYSGGMRRRLDLAAAVVAQPPVLFLDEPTTGLDPRSRLGLWETIEGQVAKGVTVLLTTQYLDEADHLADKIAVIDHGRLIAEGTGAQLKDQVGGDRLEVTLTDQSQADTARSVLAAVTGCDTTAEDHVVRAPVSRRDGTVAEALRRLDDAGVDVADLTLRRPTLDDVFLHLTGHAAEYEQPEGEVTEREEQAA